MGGQWFVETARGDTPEQAFRSAREKALFDHGFSGHPGYSGTLAEKQGFQVRKLPNRDVDVEQWVESQMMTCNDKWDDAEMVKDPEEEDLWWIYGWASN